MREFVPGRHVFDNICVSRHERVDMKKARMSSMLRTPYSWVVAISWRAYERHECQAVLISDWGRVKPICVGKLTIVGPDGLSPGPRQALIWTNAGILLKKTPGTNFIEFLIDILTFPFRKMRLKVSSAYIIIIMSWQFNISTEDQMEHDIVRMWIKWVMDVLFIHYIGM